MIAPHTIPFAFFESSSFFSNATYAQLSAGESLQQSYYVSQWGCAGGGACAMGCGGASDCQLVGRARAFAGLFAVPVGFLVMIGVSLFTAAPSEDVQRFVRGLRERTV